MEKMKMLASEPMLFCTEAEIEIADTTAADPAKK
jgi:hypothetical protein